MVSSMVVMSGCDALAPPVWSAPPMEVGWCVDGVRTEDGIIVDYLKVSCLDGLPSREVEAFGIGSAVTCSRADDTYFMTEKPLGGSVTQLWTVCLASR
mgnify:CR=1 FL=1